MVGRIIRGGSGYGGDHHKEIGTMAKVTKEEVYEYLKDKQWHTKADIASDMGCGVDAIGARLKELSEDNVAILCGSDGVRFCEISDITDEDAARAIERMTAWIVGIVSRQALNAVPMKKLMAEAKKLLPKTTEEKRIVRKYLVQLTHLIDWDEADAE
jgi:hypothetical protein